MRMVTVRLTAEATLERALEELGLPEEEVDTGYGLVAIDPAQGLYGLRVTEAGARRMDPGAGSGPYSDPPIEPYGPPQ